MEKLFSIMSNSPIHYHFKLDFQTVSQHTEGKWLVNPRHQTSQGQSVAEYSKYRQQLQSIVFLVPVAITTLIRLNVDVHVVMQYYLPYMNGKGTAGIHAKLMMS